MTQSGERLIKAAGQAREIARGDREPAKMYIPAEIHPGKAALMHLIAWIELHSIERCAVTDISLKSIADYVRELETENARLKGGAS